MVSVEEVKQALLQYTNYIKNIEAIGNNIVIRPDGYIKDKGVWQGITNAVASLGGKYVPKTNDNTWQVPLVVGQNQPAQPSTFTPLDPLAVTKHIDDIIIALEALKKEVEEMLRSEKH